MDAGFVIIEDTLFAVNLSLYREREREYEQRGVHHTVDSIHSYSHSTTSSPNQCIIPTENTVWRTVDGM